jgi:hypothetical protein
VVPGAPAPVRDADDVRRSIAMLIERGADHVKLGTLTPELFTVALAECRTRRIRCVAHVPVDPPAAQASTEGISSFEHLFGLSANASRLTTDQLRALREEWRQPTFWQRIGYRLGLRSRPPKETVLGDAWIDSTKARGLPWDSGLPRSRP